MKQFQGMVRAVSWSVLSVLMLGCAGPLAQQQAERAAFAEELAPRELLRKGDASAEAGDMTRAEQYYSAALKTGKNEKIAVQKLLNVCIADHRYPAALEYAEQHLHRHPNDSELQFAAASLYAALGNHARARLLFASVLKQRPRWSEAHYAFATILREDVESLDAANEHDLEYLKLDPAGPLAETVRARLRRSLP